MRIVLGVSGGIAAYKAIHVARQLKELGHELNVVPTSNALKFVGKATWEAISGNPVTDSVFDQIDTVNHVRLGQEADLVVIAPASANTIAKLANGLAQDLLTTTFLVTTAPVLVAPAMHTEMWWNRATQHNIQVLKDRGVHVLEPAVGRLTGADSGIGRLPEPEQITQAALELLAKTTSEAKVLDLAGVSLAVSAGGTRESLDPVRYLGNRSSGRQGVAIAQAALARGAKVTLVSANVGNDVLAPVSGHAKLQVVPVNDTAQLHQAMRQAQDEHQVLIMAAAVADYRPKVISAHKLKKTDSNTGLTIELEQNPDILAELVRERGANQLVIGFAAETGDERSDVLQHGKQKAIRKGADLLAINPVGETTGFGDVPNTLTIVDGLGEVVHTVAGTKLEVAHGLLDQVIARLHNE